MLLSNLNWTAEVIIYFISFFVLLIALIIQSKAYFQKRNKQYLVLLFAWFLLTLTSLFDGFAFLLLSFNLYRIGMISLILMGLCITILVDLLNRYSLDPLKMILFGFISSGCIISLFTPSNIKIELLSTGEPSLQASGPLYYWLTLLSLLSINLFFYYCILIHQKSPPEVKKRSFVLVIGGFIFGPASLICYITHLTKLIPGLIMITFSIGALITSLSFISTPKLLDVLLSSSKQAKIKHMRLLLDEITMTKEELETAQNYIQKQNEQLIIAQKMDTIGKTTSGIAHDFNNILQIISGNSELILMDITDDNEYFENIKEIQDASSQGAKICRNLLSYARSTENRLEPSDSIQVNEVIIRMKNILKSVIPSQISIILDIDDRLFKIDANGSEIQQVLTNLVLNARDAIHNEGTITIQTQNQEISKSHTYQYGHLSSGSYACISVMDTGTGISDEMKDHIYEPFSTSKQPGKGTGLGLFIIYNLVIKNQGHIYFDSTLGKGTQFHIMFPKSKQMD